MFRNITEKDKGNSNSFKISFIKSNTSVTWDDEHNNLLDFAEANGLTPEFNCRMGGCSACESVLVNGTVLYDPEPLMEIPSGKILICCSRPLSNLEIDL